MKVQERRRRYREGVFAWSMAPGLLMPKMAQSARKASGEILTPEEERRFLEERRRFWERRRTPCREQHEAGEPDHMRWDARQREKIARLEVSQGGMKTREEENECGDVGGCGVGE